LVKIRKDMVAETGGEEARSGEAGHRRWEQANLMETEADPTTRMDSVAVKSRSSGSHVKPPGVAAPSNWRQDQRDRYHKRDRRRG
jgi:hypothetical protein